MIPSDSNPHVFLIANGLDIGGLYGGAERFAAELALSVQAAGWKCSLGILAWSGLSGEIAWKQRLESAGVQVISLSNHRGRSLTAAFQRARQFCLQEKVTIVHSHCQIGSVVAVGLRITLPKIVAMRTIHAGLEWGKGALPAVLRLFLSHILFPLSLDAQVGVSQPICKGLQKSIGVKLSGRSVRYIPNALPDSWYEPPSRDQKRPSEVLSAPVIGCIGVLSALKNHAVLIKAVALLTQKLPRMQLWIIGDGPERTRLEEQASSLGIEKQVTFFGKQNHVQDFLCQMDLFAFSSQSEGLPTVVLESMAQGVPVIASDIPGNRELLEDGLTGWLFPPNNAQKLADAIEYVVEHPGERQKAIQRAAQKAKEFSLSAIVPQYLNLYAELTKQP